MKPLISTAIVVASLCLLTACDSSSTADKSAVTPAPSPAASGTIPAASVSAPASPAAQGAATVTASPNPVPAGEGNGTTTIKWTTGDGSMGQIYVTTDGGEETLFGGAPEGSTDAPWIQSDKTYEFRLYAGSEHSKLLAKVTVIRQK